MGKRLFVGGLPFKVTDQQLTDLFVGAGNVVFSKVIIDRQTGQSKGFGFVEMESDEQAEKAIQMFNNFDMEGRKLAVNVARPMEDRPDRGPARGNFNRNNNNNNNRRGFERRGRR